MDNSLVIPGTELRWLLSQRYPFAQHWVLDKDYNVPTEEAVVAYHKELSKHLFDLYGDKWQTYFDCDNFGFEAAVLSARKHWIARQAGRGNAQGAAIGVLVFRTIPTDLNTGHFINLRLERNRNIIEWEPQNRLQTPLTQDQCKSASLTFFF